MDQADLAALALCRVLSLCEKWDAMSKGETSTTRQIREAVRGA